MYYVDCYVTKLTSKVETTPTYVFNFRENFVKCTHQCRGVTQSEGSSLLISYKYFRAVYKKGNVPWRHMMSVLIHIHYIKISGFVTDHKGHPFIFFSIDTWWCKSKLRILRAAGTHYLLLQKFLHNVHTAIRSHMFVPDIDQALCGGDFRDTHWDDKLCWQLM